MTDLASFFDQSKEKFGEFKPKIAQPEASSTATYPVDAPSADNLATQVLPCLVAEKVTEDKLEKGNDGTNPKKKKKKKTKQPAITLEKDEEGSPAATATDGEAEATDGIDEAAKIKSECTVFVGNVSLKATAEQIRSHFAKQCGPVISARLRSVPTLGCAVNQHGNQKLVKKVCVNQKKFVDGRDSCNAYIVFKTKESAQKALAMNGTEFMGMIIRVDSENPSLDPKCSVFVGGLPFDISDETVWKHFASKIGDEADAVKNVRIIRDKETGLGKGFGYVLLKNVSTVAAALKLHDSKLANRKIRVMVCGKRFKGNAATLQKENKSKFEGTRARAGAHMRIQKKTQLLSTIPEDKIKSMKKVDGKETMMKKKPFKLSKPKHSARKAAQAEAVAKGEVYVKPNKSKQAKSKETPFASTTKGEVSDQRKKKVDSVSSSKVYRKTSKDTKPFKTSVKGKKMTMKKTNKATQGVKMTKKHSGKVAAS